MRPPDSTSRVATDLAANSGLRYPSTSRLVCTRSVVCGGRERRQRHERVHGGVSARGQPGDVRGRMVGGEHRAEPGRLGGKRHGGNAIGSEEVGVTVAVEGKAERDEHRCSLGMSGA